MFTNDLSPEERTLKTILSLGCRMFQVGRQTDVCRVRGFLPCKGISWKRNGVFAQIWGSSILNDNWAFSPSFSLWRKIMSPLTKPFNTFVMYLACFAFDVARCMWTVHPIRVINRFYFPSLVLCCHINILCTSFSVKTSIQTSASSTSGSLMARRIGC